MSAFLDGLVHLSAAEIQALHDGILEDLPGLKGNKPNISVDALTGRIHSNLSYGNFTTIDQVAALYAQVIARGHAFNDGNKRTGLLSMVTFLDLNGYVLAVDQDEIAKKMMGLADGLITYADFAPWLEERRNLIRFEWLKQIRRTMRRFRSQ
jgi:death-on-curing protein